MENSDVLGTMIQLLDKLGTIGLLLWMVYIERQEKRELQDAILDDWKAHNAKESARQKDS